MNSNLTSGANISQAAKVRSQLRPAVAPPASVTPWEKEAPAGKVSKAYQNKAPDTCPWGTPSVDEQSVKSTKRSAQHNTCPWGDGGQVDAHSAALQRAERHKQRPPPSQIGCAGVGAPRIDPNAQQSQPQELQNDDYPSSNPGPGIDSSQLSPTYDSEAEAQERSLLIEKCLQHGLSDEEIEEVLKEHMFQKLMEREQREAESDFGKAETLKPGMAPGNQMPSPEAPPQAQPPRENLRDRKKAEVTAKVTAGSDIAASRNSFFQAQQAANAVKDRNRMGQGIF